MSRRRFLAASAMAAFGSAVGANHPGASSGERSSPDANGVRTSSRTGDRSSTGTATVPWRNWSGGLVCQPAGRFSPGSEDELASFLAARQRPVRPVGSGHSFSPLVPTDGHLIVLDRLTGVLEHDRAALTATIAAGSRLGDLGAPLDAVGQAMFILPDIDRQTVAGAIATATHGTGLEFTCLSGYVKRLRLVTPVGEVVDVDASATPELFGAARVCLGALGVVTRVTLQNRTPYRLRARNWVEPTEDVLARFDEAAARHRHFEMFPLTHSDYALVLAIDETDAPIHHPPVTPEEDAAFADAMAAWAAVPPRERLPLVNETARQIEPSEAVDASYRILSNIRNHRFNEMEYSVPIEAGAACLREVLRTIIDEEVDVVFPLEYRYVRRDDTWLGMSSGDEDHAAISIHRMASEDHRPYFDLIEPIFWKYGGRPHWGKLHSLGAAELSKLYPRFADFQALRARLDPEGRMLNEHLRRIFIS